MDVPLTTVYGYHIRVSDVRQACLQFTEATARRICNKSSVPELRLDPSQRLQCLKSLFDLCNSGDLRHPALERHQVERLAMNSFRSDPAVHTFMDDRVLKGFSEGHLDEPMAAINSVFKIICNQSRLELDKAGAQYLRRIFAGFHLGKTSDEAVLQDRNQYPRSSKELPIDCSGSEFRSMRLKLALLADTKQDCIFDLYQLSHVTKRRFQSDKT